MEDTNLSNRSKLYSKVYKAIPQIETIGKEKQGTNYFKYADGLKIRSEVNKVIKTQQLLLDAPR